MWRTIAEVRVFQMAYVRRLVSGHYRMKMCDGLLTMRKWHRRRNHDVHTRIHARDLDMRSRRMILCVRTCMRACVRGKMLISLH